MVTDIDSPAIEAELEVADASHMGENSRIAALLLAKEPMLLDERSYWPAPYDDSTGKVRV
jgi:hypothetical protein